ncbi:DUF7686 domain-containing protein [Ornithinibacillus californiensis]|uniref:DUF7686 domain-containing protein n=1 Tax=Ornithinibacillus californiensis TaxID=161536 RepID=UPI00064DAC96|nr:hypothetical protein [Ornithinibacillus californiensis]
MDKCFDCGNKEVKVSLQLQGKSINLCNECFNNRMSDDLGVTLEQPVETFSLKDNQGISRTFHVEIHLFPNGIYLEAVENIEYGYKFAVHGELDADQQELLSKLVEKTRKGITKQHVETEFFPSGQEYQTITGNQLKGIFEYNEESSDSPLVIIDGKPFTWTEVGKMVTSFEGFQFKLEMFDMTEDVE